MSSSSFAPESMTELLGDALAVLDVEARLHARALPEALGPRTAGLELDGEPMRVWGGGERLGLEPGSSTGDVRARLDLDTLVALVDERLSVVEALRRRKLHVLGRFDDLRHASRACHVLMHGLVRAPSGPALLARLRRMQTKRRNGP